MMTSKFYNGVPKTKRSFLLFLARYSRVSIQNREIMLTLFDIFGAAKT